MQLDFKARELTIKLVYYGPALSGKTTNLQAIHSLVDPAAAGRLMTLETKDDRTLFFDMLPLSFGEGQGLTTRIKLFTVPGQVIHSATRKLVLKGADGVAFVADSQLTEARANQQAFVDMQSHLNELGMDPQTMPMVIQFNKRDLPEIRSDAELDAMAARGREPVFKAIATRGVGVIETLLGLLKLTWANLEATHQLEAKFGLSEDAVLREVHQKVRDLSATEVRS